MNYPVTLGHEFCGVISKAGRNVVGFAEGDRVASETAASICGRCAYCRSGAYNLCPNRLGLSAPRNLPGEIVQQLSRATLAAMQLPEVQKRLALDAIETRLMSPQEFTTFVESETARWTPLAKSLAGTPQQ